MFLVLIKLNILCPQKASQDYRNFYSHILFHVIHLLLFLSNKGNSGNKNHHYFLKLLLLIMWIIFLLQDNVILLFANIRRTTCFSRFEFCFVFEIDM